MIVVPPKAGRKMIEMYFSPIGAQQIEMHLLRLSLDLLREPHAPSKIESRPSYGRVSTSYGRVLTLLRTSLTF